MGLQAETAAKAADPSVHVLVNGPEDAFPDWSSIDWRQVEEDVRRLRQRIFTASQAGDLSKVRNLQKLMLRSRANALMSVRRVTEINAGRATAGVDGKVVAAPENKAEWAGWVQLHSASWTSLPVKRVYVPKANGKQRGLGIPVIVDRMLQAATLNALEPEWEARFEPRSYGFRPGRGCHDAIEAIWWTARGKTASRQWVLDADLAAAFDRIDHGRLMAAIGSFPARDRIAGWLKAGMIEKGRFTSTEEGTPQGGVISPLLLNIALHGMERAAGAEYQTTGHHAGRTVVGTPVLVRYADDVLVLWVSRDQAEQVKTRLAAWLEPRGLAFNEEKTRIVHLAEGFDFLGFNIRRYRNGKLLTKPSTAAVKRIKDRLRNEVRDLRGNNAGLAVGTLNPIIRGWAAYYRTAVSSRIFNSLDAYMWTLLYKWARRGHRNKPKRWVIARYFGAFNKSRNDRWVFGDQSTGAFLAKFAWTKIVRHQMVSGAASPDDPALSEYWAARRRKRPLPPVDRLTLRLLKKQDGRCKWCGNLLLYAEFAPQSPREWEHWARSVKTATAKKAISYQGDGTSDYSTIGLIHAACRRQILGPANRDTTQQTAREPPGLA
ncbi:group II intron reverse transcriptase/maturase [Amycolatopsis sp. NPDC059090]|uniref:group II intron reverse transcriptase/maturase n=1 Tax=Amycolatopsis sp. NPDC059090 TaxID=3346723 RepID=UPI00366B7B28